MMRPAWLALSLLAGCSGAFSLGKAGDDTASSGGTGSGGDADADADSDTDTDTGLPVDCDADPGTPAPDSASCITRTLSCGDSVVDTTAGGLSELDGSNYSSHWACAVVGTSSYTGPERVYEVEHPGTGTMTIRLTSPCAELDLFTMHWEATDECPREGVAINECDGDTSSGDGEIAIWNNQPARYLVVVDGPDGEEANFGLAVACE